MGVVIVELILGASGIFRKFICGQQGGNFLGNNFFAAGNFFFAQIQIIARDALQVVHVVEVDVIEFADSGVNVARHGDVNQQQRSVFTPFHQRFQCRAIENMLRRGGAANGNVNALKFVRPIFKRHGARAKFGGQCGRAAAHAAADLPALWSGLLDEYDRLTGRTEAPAPSRQDWDRLIGATK